MAVWGVKLNRRAGGPLLSGVVFLYHVNDHLQTAFKEVAYLLHIRGIIIHSKYFTVSDWLKAAG